MTGASILDDRPLADEATTAITPGGLRRFIATCGHDPVAFELGPAPAPVMTGLQAPPQAAM